MPTSNIETGGQPAGQASRQKCNNKMQKCSAHIANYSILHTNVQYTCSLNVPAWVGRIGNELQINRTWEQLIGIGLFAAGWKVLAADCMKTQPGS